MKILGTGSALPKMTLTNDMLTQYFDTSDAWISSRTGIKQRQVITLLDERFNVKKNCFLNVCYQWIDAQMQTTK